MAKVLSKCVKEKLHGSKVNILSILKRKSNISLLVYLKLCILPPKI